MKFKENDIVYVVWRCDFITKEKISYADKDLNCYFTENIKYIDDENVFKKLSIAKVYARKLLDKRILKVSKYIDNVNPKLGS